MIFHKLVWRFLRCGDDVGFYSLQASDAVEWLGRNGVRLGQGIRALDLGCGLGLIGGEFLARGCEVTFTDEHNWLLPQYADEEFLQFDIEKDDPGVLGGYDLVICSNVLEHLSRPDVFIGQADRLLSPGGKLYLSWTNWLSPWGGHEFSPFHYLGISRGHLVYDRVMRRPRDHTPGVNVFPTWIGRTLAMLEGNPRLEVLKAVPRYYPELTFITRIPIIREVLTWNCAVLAEKTR